MSTKILSVVERAYHGTLEDQDDTILWLSHMLKNSGACISVLLRANAVNYLVRGQDASGLVIGGIPLYHPPELEADVQRMIEAGINVYAVSEDLEDHGIGMGEIIGGVELVSRDELGDLFDQHDRSWHW